MDCEIGCDLVEVFLVFRDECDRIINHYRLGAFQAERLGILVFVLEGVRPVENILVERCHPCGVGLPSGRIWTIIRGSLYFPGLVFERLQNRRPISG